MTEPRVVLASDVDFPAGLRELEGLSSIRVRGRLPDARGVAIVGSRECSVDGGRFARQLASGLAQEGLAIWSGGALGIDAEAHLGALEGGGVTVAVVASGVSQPSPTGHRALFEEIVRRGGAIVSRREQDDAASGHGPFFHQRNQIIAAAAEVTVVAECALKSGALSTARYARKLGRKLAFVPQAPWSAHGAGCLAAVCAGDRAVGSVAGVLALLGLTPRGELGPLFSAARASELELTPLETRLVQALDRPLHVDQICDSLGESVGVVVPALMALALRGVLIEEPAGIFARA